jgi:hypothetical protein
MRSVKGRATSAASPGAQGTLGGVPHTAGPPPGRVPAVLGEEVYLWILVVLEVGVIAYFRTALSRYHGG